MQTKPEPAQIIQEIRKRGQTEIADRLDYLVEVCGDDDPEEPDIDLDSLRHLALFLADQSQPLGQPKVGIDPDGLLQGEWSLKGAAQLIMAFLPTGYIRLAAFEMRDDLPEMPHIQGILPKQEAVRTARVFVDSRKVGIAG